MEKCLYVESGTCGGGRPCKLEQGHKGYHIESDSCSIPISDDYDVMYGEPDKCKLILGHSGKCALSSPRGPAGRMK